MKRWKMTNGPRPVEVECEQTGYPHRDADGDTQYANSHFDTEAQAWTALLGELRAGVRLACDAVAETRLRLAEAEAVLVKRSLRRDEAERAHEEWEAARG